MPSAVGGLWPGAITPLIGRQHPGRVIGVEVDRQDRMRSPTGGSASYKIQGVTRDSNANPLGSCTVMVFYTASDQLYTKIVSDVNGYWAALVPDTTTLFYAVSFNSTGLVSGVTVNNLAGV